MSVRECCVCGNAAKGKQWWNRDRGYGICSRCAIEEPKRMARRGMSQTDIDDEMLSLYGKAGVNYFTEAAGNA